jgi:hypothetical protein
LEKRRAVWVLQACILANELLQKQFAPHGYYKCVNILRIWRHVTCLITFSLVVNNFGIKYVGKEHVNHLTKRLKEKYKLTKDWTGDLHSGISPKWNYVARTLYISMLRYIKKQLLKYKHTMRQIQHCPYSPEPKRYGTDAQSPLPSKDTQKLTYCDIKHVQKIVRSILYYAWVDNMMVLMALSTIASEQTKETECTLEKAYQVLVTWRRIPMRRQSFVH